MTFLCLKNSIYCLIRILGVIISSLQTSLEIKRLFVQNVSHEVRTPLHSTLGGLGMLGMALDRDPVLDRELLREIVQDATLSCNIAVDIMSELLLYEKIEGGHLSLEREEVSVWDFATEVFKMFLLQVS